MAYICWMCKRIKTQELKGKCKRAYIDLVCKDETIGASSNQNPCPKLEQKSVSFSVRFTRLKHLILFNFQTKKTHKLGSNTHKRTKMGFSPTVIKYSWAVDLLTISATIYFLKNMNDFGREKSS